MNKISVSTSSTIRRVLIGGALEFGPILIFLLSFHFFHIYKATLILMVATILSTIATYRLQKRLPYLALYVALLTVGFGYVTLVHHQPKFIQMRDTMYDVTCALTLLGGLMVRISFLKLAFDEVVPMTNRAWTKLTYAWTAFFIMNAIANEYVRRTMNLHAWFEFKSIVAAITIVFGLTTLYFFYEKNQN